MKVKKWEIILLIFLVAFFPISVKAANTNGKPEVKMNDNGEVTWRSFDTKATTPITWHTEGYTVKNYKVLANKLVGTNEYGNPRYKKPYGEFLNKKEYSQIVGLKDGIYEVEWTIPKEVVRKQCENAGVNAKTLADEGGYLYINGFFRTYHSGRPYSNYIYDLRTIMTAESWTNPYDFRDRFDIPVQFDSEPQPVEITFRELSNYKFYDLKTRNCNKKKALNYFIPKESTISLTTLFPENQKSKIKSGKKLWAYRAHLEYIESGKIIRNSKVTFKSNPVTAYRAYLKELNEFRNSKWEVPYGGLRVVVTYRAWKEKEDGVPEDNKKSISDDFTDPQPPNNKLEGVIDADVKGNELFEVEEGIPTTEKLYSYVVGQEYLISYIFTNYSGIRHYQQVIPSGSPEVPPSIITVKRRYSYWKLTQLDVYEIDHAVVSNYALPNKKIKLLPAKSYKKPQIKIRHSSGMREPSSGGRFVGQIKVQNDFLSVNGIVLMKDGWYQASTPLPSRLSRPNVIEDKILFQEAMVIERNKENGEWDSTGSLVYRNIKSVGESQGQRLAFDFDVNSVIIHTPTVCDGQIQDVKEYNQLIYPDRTSAGLILDRYFQVYLPTVGMHHNYKNYGYRDYAKYIDKREVKFPFDIYRNGVYVPANTWIRLVSDTTNFYLPHWVKEGNYIVEFKATALNCDANQGSDEREDLANYNLSHYVATDTVQVQVSGRLYGFNLYDITDYPLWQNVFREKNSNNLIGNCYKVGRNDRNGNIMDQNNKMTLPLFSGSHPTKKCEGAIRAGYLARFSIFSMGNMYEGREDYIRIKPRFYYISKNGTNREEVDVYYDETFQGRKQFLIKVGSERDRKNKKTMRLGDVCASVPRQEIVNTATILGLSEETLKNQNHYVYTFGNIMIPWGQRTFVGTWSNPPTTVGKVRIQQSIQKWYGEYYLPSNLHVVTKEFPVTDYARTHGIDYKEEFWKKDGYLILNFDIETIQNKERHLSYINSKNEKEGYCNMWKKEGFQYQKKDCKENWFIFKDGDFLFYYIDQSAAKDYLSGGTH